MSPTRSIRHRRQVGESKIGCIFWTVLAILFAYVSWQMVPVKMKSVDLEQFMVRTAERSSLSARHSEKRIREAIMNEADELKLPLKSEDLLITRTGARVRIEAHYTVQINFFVTTWDWKLSHKVERSIMRI